MSFLNDLWECIRREICCCCWVLPRDERIEKDSSSNRSQNKQRGSKKQRDSSREQKESKVQIYQSSGFKPELHKPLLPIFQPISIEMQSVRQYSRLSEQFKTPNSQASFVSRGDRRTFNIVAQIPTVNMLDSSFHSIVNRSTSLIATIPQEEGLQLKEWLQREYEQNSLEEPIRLSSSILTQLTKKFFVQSLVHRMEDYYTFHLTETQCHEPAAQSQMTCSFFKQSPMFDSKFLQTRYLSMITIHCNTLDTLKILKLINRRQFQQKLMNFHKISLLKMRDLPKGMLGMQMEQYSPELSKKSVYQVVKQVDKVKFADEDIVTFLAVDINIDHRAHYERVCRVSVEEQGKIEIYTESEERIIGKPEDYFRKRWKSLKQQLRKQKIIVK